MSFLIDEDSLNLSFHSRLQTSPSGFSTNFHVVKFGQETTMATIQMTRMESLHCFELISEGRRGNTTATNRSTAIRTRLWMDTALETSVTKYVSLHNAWSRGPLSGQWLAVFDLKKRRGKRMIEYNRSEIAMFTIKILTGVLRVFSCRHHCNEDISSQWHNK